MVTMRLDKYLADSGLFTRSEAGRAVRQGRVSVNGAVVRDPAMKIDENAVRVTADGQAVGYTEFRYIMLNKPSDTVSTTEDDPKSVMKLLPPAFSRMDMFPCGRLDIDTLGLLILTDDGQTAHRLISPKHHAEKVYKFGCANELGDDDIARLESGVDLDDGYHTLPAKVRYEGNKIGYITLTEGKYHQIKRMFVAVGNKITYLERVSFGGVVLDESLERGEYRYLNEDEKKLLITHN